MTVNYMNITFDCQVFNDHFVCLISCLFSSPWLKKDIIIQRNKSLHWRVRGRSELRFVLKVTQVKRKTQKQLASVFSTQCCSYAQPPSRTHTYTHTHTNTHHSVVRHEWFIFRRSIYAFLLLYVIGVCTKCCIGMNVMTQRPAELRLMKCRPRFCAVLWYAWVDLSLHRYQIDRGSTFVLHVLSLAPGCRSCIARNAETLSTLTVSDWYLNRSFPCGKKQSCTLGLWGFLLLSYCFPSTSSRSANSQRCSGGAARTLARRTLIFMVGLESTRTTRVRSRMHVGSGCKNVQRQTKISRRVCHFPK